MRLLKRQWVLKLGVVSMCLAWAGCGYTLSNRRRDDLAKVGVQTVFVKPVQNNSYKPGVENILYNHIVGTLAAYRSIRMVLSESEADAILVGAVNSATSAAVASPLGDQIFPS